jgi:hypothetical protein
MRSRIAIAMANATQAAESRGTNRALYKTNRFDNRRMIHRPRPLTLNPHAHQHDRSDGSGQPRFLPY